VFEIRTQYFFVNLIAARMPAQDKDSVLVFNGLGGGAQIDPQVAVGGGYVLSIINWGVSIFSKEGAFIQGGPASCLNGDIDPKICFQPFGKRFIYASARQGEDQARIAVSKTNDPRQGWWSYSVPIPTWNDGGAVGVGKYWIVYSYPSSRGQSNIIIDRKKAEDGQIVSAKEFIFNNPGQPVYTYDTAQENLYFVKLNDTSIKVNYINPAGEFKTQPAVNTGLSLSYPTRFTQKGGAQCSAGDINAKNAVLRNGYIWTSHAATISTGGVTRTQVRFYQLDLTGKIIQTGAIDDPTGTIFSGQTTVAVNKNNDLLLVFQQCTKNSYISSRMSYRLASDPLGSLRPVINLAEGQGANTGAAWGDYSGASVDGDDDFTLWGINSVASTSGGGNTSIFKLIRPVLTSIVMKLVEVPAVQQLKSSHKNTVLQYNLLVPGRVIMNLYNSKGSLITTLCNSNKPAGINTVSLPLNLAQGTYIISLKTNGLSEKKTIFLVK